MTLDEIIALDSQNDRRARMSERYGPSLGVTSADNYLRQLTIRDQIHPFDAVAVFHRDQDAAKAWGSCNSAHGSPMLGIVQDGDRWALVLDMREDMDTVIDPAAPDDASGPKWRIPKVAAGK